MAVWHHDDQPGPRVPSPQSAQGEWWSAGFRRFSWTASASSLQFGCTASQAWTCIKLFSLNFWITGCVIIMYLVEFHAITKILLKKLPKIFNYQKSQKNREILPKVIKITKSGHTTRRSKSHLEFLFLLSNFPNFYRRLYLTMNSHR
jgi:hypothetical protein